MRLLFILLFSPFLISAQSDTNKGIHFESSLNWDQIKAKAQAENKYIFVDCYATWCKPCKIMDKDIYTKDTVGKYINSKFISIKVQMDTSSSDNSEVRNWYSEADRIKKEFNISSLPTFLFFSPAGLIKHKGVGFKSVNDFLLLSEEALDVQKQYFTLIEKYRNRQLIDTLLPYLAINAKQNSDDSLSLEISKYYISKRLSKYSQVIFFTKPILSSIATFQKVLTSKDKVFWFFYKYPGKIDSIMGVDYAQQILNNVIYKEEITPKLNFARTHNTLPDWKIITRSIKNKYGQFYAEINTLNAKVKWFKFTKDWTEYVKHLVIQINLKNINELSVIELNNNAMEVFRYSDNNQELNEAIHWVDIALPKELNFPAVIMDTKANLLYKLGKKEEAIELEEKAIKLMPEMSSFLETVKKMKAEIPTWEIVGASVIANGTSKTLIDTSVLGKWPTLENKVWISPNGKYFAYEINNFPLGRTTTVIQSVNNNWKKEFIGIEGLFFSKDSRKIIFNNTDTLTTLLLGTDSLNKITNCISTKFPQANAGEWMAYLVKTQLTLLNLVTGVGRKLDSVADYRFNENGKLLLVKREINSDNTAMTLLNLISLPENTLTTIWKSSNGSSVKLSNSDLSFDIAGQQLAFLVTEKKKYNNLIYYYKSGMEEAIVKVKKKEEGNRLELSVYGSPQFSSNGRWLFFQLQPQIDTLKPKGNSIKVDIWSYKDVVLQPDQIVQAQARVKVFTAVIGVDKDVYVQLEKENEHLETTSDKITGDFAITKDNDSNREYWWNLNPQPSFYIVSLIDGSKRLIKKDYPYLNYFEFSPLGNILTYFDYKRGDYFSLDLKNSREFNISKSIPQKVFTELSRGYYPAPVEPIVGWVGENSVLLSDNYDLWRVDIMGLMKPVCITQGYGRKHHIALRLVDEKNNLSDNSTILLTAFNTLTKYSGFFKTTVNANSAPKLLSMGPYTFYRKESQKPHGYSFDDGMKPVKAANENIWIAKRQSTTEAPNYFLTRDFVKYDALTQLHPQSKFNWITAELVNYKQMDGSDCQGVLYKPEDYNPAKKYPVIFNYYEWLSHRLYEFPYPRFTTSNINIPWFVSNGYLVFTPDIHYSIAKVSNKTTGESAYNSVLAAAQFLSKLPYVRGDKMAIQGHSFGGGETNYLVTHTTNFAAAAEVAGDSDPISAYLTLAPAFNPIEHYNKQSGTEMGQGRYGVTPWERPDLYSRQSAVLNADKTVSPLLIMHNMKDNSVQWRQGVEFYMALRRLGKKVWMLQYDNGIHSVFRQDAVDYTIRLTQFFNHYLKDSAAPIWMTQGIPARLKGVETGYALDSANSCGPTCKICKKINAIYNKQHGISAAVSSNQKGEMKKEE